MTKKKDQCGWMFLFCAEDSSTRLGKFSAHPRTTRLYRTGKIMLWLGLSILLGMGVSQLG